MKQTTGQPRGCPAVGLPALVFHAPVPVGFLGGPGVGFVRAVAPGAFPEDGGLGVGNG